MDVDFQPKGSDRLQNRFLPIFPWSSRRAFDFLLPNNTACQPMERFVLCQNCIQPGFGIWFSLERFLFLLLFELGEVLLLSFLISLQLLLLAVIQLRRADYDEAVDSTGKLGLQSLFPVKSRTFGLGHRAAITLSNLFPCSVPQLLGYRISPGKNRY